MGRGWERARGGRGGFWRWGGNGKEPRVVVKAMGEEQWEAVGETLGAEVAMGGTPNDGGGGEGGEHSLSTGEGNGRDLWAYKG